VWKGLAEYLVNFCGLSFTFIFWATQEMQDDVLSIEEAFGDLTDPRSRPSPYDLTQMLVVALCAILSGADSWVAIQVWGEEKLDWLRRHILLEPGIPSHDTFGRVFAALDPK
jgi:hypothetical protein